MSGELQICRVKISIDSVRLETALEGNYCVQFCLSGVKSLGSTSDVPSNNKNIIQFKEIKTLGIAVRKDALQSSSLDLHLHFKNQPSSDNERKKDQLIGILKIPLAALLTQNIYNEMREYALQLSALNSFITFSCETKERKVGQGSQKNQQNSSMQVLEGSYSPPSQHSEYLYPSSRKSLQSKEWQELLVHQASFFTQQHHLPRQESGALEQRISELEKADLQTLLKDNYRLERLLYIARNERKIESGRHEQELKDMARELSLREAENIQLREELDNVNDRFGQLLDEFSGITRQKEELQMALNSQKIVNEKLQLSHDTLSARVKTICNQSQTISKLQEQLSITTKSLLQLQEQLDVEKQRVLTLQFHNEQLQDKLQKSLEVIEQLQEEIKSKDEMVNICKQYEQRLSQLEEKIDCIEEEGESQAEFVHRGSYSSYQAQNNQIRIEEDDNSLRKIIEEELQQSLSLQQNVKTSQDYKSNQFFTATTLLDPQRNQLQLLQLLTQNLQREYDDFKRIYREQEEVLSYKHKELGHLEKEIANMRYEFLLELSHVTALMNQQILENRQLREENLKLKSRQQDHSKQQKTIQKSRESQFGTVKTSLSSWKEQLAMSVSERDELKQRCKQLQEDNQVLLKYNIEREQLYEMMMVRKCQNSDDFVAQRFENTLKYILEHREQYGSLLKRYVFCQQNNQENTALVESQRLIVESAENASEVITNLPQKVETESQIQKFDTFRSQSPDLLIQSTARGRIIDPVLPNILSELIDLTRSRQSMGMFGFKKDVYKEQKRDQLSSQIRSKIQRLKVVLLKQTKPEILSQYLQLFKQLETAIQEYCLS